jgi:hypothetical protein
MRTPWIILTALAIAGIALAQTPPPGPTDGDPKAPARKATVSKPPESPGPRTGPGQSGSGAAAPGTGAKGAPADAQKPAK